MDACSDTSAFFRGFQFAFTFTTFSSQPEKTQGAVWLLAKPEIEFTLVLMGLLHDPQMTENL